MLRKLASRAGRAVLVVIHDPEVRSEGKVFATKVAVRLLIALGATPTVIALIEKAVSAL